MTTPADRLDTLRGLLRECAPVAVAFSGGLDSAFLLRIAHEELGEGAVAVTALSASYAAEERERAEALTAAWGIAHGWIETKELSDPRYAINDPSRCYHCKDELFAGMAAIVAERFPGATLADGTTCDDLGDFRPGLRAAAEHGVRHLLVEAGLTKADLRELARGMDLPIADLPGTACLASRFPYGTAITEVKLRRIEAAERAVRSLGFPMCRVRDHDPIARIELPPGDLDRLADPALRTALSAAVKALGFTYIAVDLEGYRSGALNEVLRREPANRG